MTPATPRIEKSPRLIRRGDVVVLKAGKQEEVVRGIQIVLQLANGMTDTYDSGERVVMGDDTDVTPAELVEAAQADAAERAQQASVNAEADAAANG